jgi:hypothetical protein
MNLFALSPFANKNTQQNAAFPQYNPQARSPFWLLKSASQQAYARLLPKVSWSWTVLVPSDTHKNPITSITAALLPFVTYLQILPRTLEWLIQGDKSGQGVQPSLTDTRNVYGIFIGRPKWKRPLCIPRLR